MTDKFIGKEAMKEKDFLMYNLTVSELHAIESREESAIQKVLETKKNVS